MSYNTRRSGNFAPQSQTKNPQTQVPSVAGIGQRRPVSSSNFVPGGQLNAQNKGGIQQQQQQQRTNVQQQPQQQQQSAAAHNTAANTGINFRNQNQIPQKTVSQGYQTSQQVPIKAEPQISNLAGVNPPNPATENANGDSMEVDSQETPKKKFWVKTGKVSKKEKMRRRNMRLSKVLQPKNAVMILNELVKNTSYLVEETNVKTDFSQFKATVLVDDIEHVGYGRSKIHAKNAAAECALKHLVTSNKLSEMKKDEEGNEKMDVSEDGNQPPLPWQHVASFALYKLFTSWGEDPNKSSKVASAIGMTSPTAASPSPLNIGPDGQPISKPHENKPAKKMPLNPETMNPLMLANQMLPHAVFEEIGKSGAPPHLIYSYRCTVDGQSFIGTGSNKKAAKKLAAFAACHKVLGINYPTEVYVPSY